MSPTTRDGRPIKGPQADTADTAESRDRDAAGKPNPREERDMNDDNGLGIQATLRRMALVRQNVLSVNGGYRPSSPRSE